VGLITVPPALLLPGMVVLIRELVFSHGMGLCGIRLPITARLMELQRQTILVVLTRLVCVESRLITQMGLSLEKLGKAAAFVHSTAYHNDL